MEIRSKKFLLLSVTLLIFCFFLVGCNSVPSEDEIASFFTDEFTSEITEYYIEGSLESFDIEDVELLRRQTNDKTDTADCNILLSHSNYEGKVNATLHFEYYDQGGWQLFDWNIRSVYKELHADRETGC